MFRDGDKVNVTIGSNDVRVEGELVFTEYGVFVVHNSQGSGCLGCTPHYDEMRGYRHGWQLCLVNEFTETYGTDWRDLELMDDPSYSGSILKFKMK
jgi:hypothetical protein